MLSPPNKNPVTRAMVRDNGLISSFCFMRKMVIVYDVLIIPCPMLLSLFTALTLLDPLGALQKG